MSGWSPCRRHPTLGIPVPPACRKMIDRGALVAGLTTEDVFRVIRDADQSPHWIHAQGVNRCSCSFCIFGSNSDLRRAAELHPDLYRNYADLDTLSPSGTPLPEPTGIPPDRADPEDPAGLNRARQACQPARPRPARYAQKKRDGIIRVSPARIACSAMPPPSTVTKNVAAGRFMK